MPYRMKLVYEPDPWNDTTRSLSERIEAAQWAKRFGVADRLRRLDREIRGILGDNDDELTRALAAAGDTHARYSPC
jgi:hypothetical protein